MRYSRDDPYNTLLPMGCELADLVTPWSSCLSCPFPSGCVKQGVLWCNSRDDWHMANHLGLVKLERIRYRDRRKIKT